MSALDTVSGSYVIENTLPVELPPVDPNYDSYDYQGGSPQGALSETLRSVPGISFTGALQAVSAAASTGLGIWKNIEQINMSARTQSAQSEIDKLKLDVLKQQTVGSLEYQKAVLDTNRQVTLIQAASAVDQAKRAAVSSRGGTFTSSQSMDSNLIVFGGLAALLYFATKKGGSK